MPVLTIQCQACGAEFPLREALNDNAWRELCDLALSLPPVVHRPVWDYLELFTPKKQKLRVSRMLAIVQELAPMIHAARIERNRTSYAVPAETFAKAMRFLVQTPPPSLVLPLKGNGYLVSLLANRAEQAAAQTEKQQEQQRRHGHARLAQNSGAQKVDPQALFDAHMESLGLSPKGDGNA